MIASAKMRESKYLQAPHAADEKIWCLPLMNGNREKKHCWKDLPSCPPSFKLSSARLRAKFSLQTALGGMSDQIIIWGPNYPFTSPQHTHTHQISMLRNTEAQTAEIPPLLSHIKHQEQFVLNIARNVLTMG